ncbi:SOUL family heme-binding protein [Mycobacterium paraterrae]|uniref:Heme-binding protein n=1 Tax=Mycobacterium paraterrae TaxID=577492 RepID=A0ABY3VR10_9MYCO|nr:heme-binding protein [Mycobacterium paraterrae]UMB69949.1 heme-binding protein [Mycobacterium paraterrae]
MLKATARIAKSLVEAGGSVVGFRGLTEEPAYSAEPLADGVEVRRYPSRIAAQTAVDADEVTARRIGFQRLAGYIFGKNHTVVEQSRRGSGEKIAMTAPVAQQADADGQWLIRFFMPADKTRESLPDPDDPAVSLVTVPPETVAVKRFSGSTDPKAVAAKATDLLRTLDGQGMKAVGTPAAWFYDPPWTVPPLRRNEVWVAVEPRG